MPDSPTSHCPAWCTVPAEHHALDRQRQGCWEHFRVVWTDDAGGSVEAVRNESDTGPAEPRIRVCVDDQIMSVEEARQFAAAVYRATGLAGQGAPISIDRPHVHGCRLDPAHRGACLSDTPHQFGPDSCQHCDNERGDDQ